MKNIKTILILDDNKYVNTDITMVPGFLILASSTETINSIRRLLLDYKSGRITPSWLTDLESVYNNSFSPQILDINNFKVIFPDTENAIEYDTLISFSRMNSTNILGDDYNL